jgi:ferrous iron transport protein A
MAAALPGRMTGFYTQRVCGNIERSFLSRTSDAPGPLPMANAPPTLEAVALGAAVRVDDVTGSDAVAIRLLEMGLTPGTVVRVVGQAPFGDPLELEIRGYRLSIRRAEAARVSVTAA